MQLHDWHDGGQHAFACRIDASPDNAAEHRLLLAWNPQPHGQTFVLPARAGQA